MVSKARRELKDSTVRGAPPAAKGKRDYYWDTKVTGFGLQVTEKGHKSYIYYSRFPPSRSPSRRLLGDAKMGLATAREMAREWERLIAEGKDPSEIKRQDDLARQREKQTTFSVVAEAWLKKVVVKQRKGAEVAQDVRREFIARWGDRPVTEIRRQDVHNVIDTVNDRAPAQARNLLGYAHRLFAWAEAQDYGLLIDPTEKLKAKDLVGKKIARQRVLTDPELRALWQATENLGYPYRDIVRMLTLTGQRKSEVADARWREFDLDKKLWIVPAERMKSNAAHSVPLTDDVTAILLSLPRFNEGDCLFSTTFGKKPVDSFSRAKRALDEMMTVQLGGPADHWVIHDIRRTMRTHLSALPIPDMVRELVISHTRPGMHKVYDQYAYLDEKRDALEKWQIRLRGIVNPPSAGANVVQLRGA